MSEHYSFRRRERTAPTRSHEQTLREIETLQRRLDELSTEMVWSNRLTSLGTLAAVLAHEYNNLLTPISSYAQLALNNPDDPDLTRKALQMAIDGVGRASAIASATLAFAGPGESGDNQPGSIHDAIEQTLLCIGRPLEQDGIDLKISVPACTVTLGDLPLQQVLVNLISNARKAVLKQSRPRRIELRGRIKEGGLIVEVSDTGPGIPEVMLDRLFEPFVSTAAPAPDCPRTTGKTVGDSNAAGTGLGLSICRGLVESAGGWIEADSEPGRGATLRLWLPVVEADPQG